MKVVPRLRAIFASPSKDIQAVMPELMALREKLATIHAVPNKVAGIVELFQLLAPYCDRGGYEQTIAALQRKNYGQLDRVIIALQSLQKHLMNAGRSEYGMNRTRPGEAVTAAKVFLGGVYGIWTKSAAYWLEHQQQFEKDERDDLTTVGAAKPVTTWYCINDYQAGSIIKRCVTGMLMQIQTLKAAS